MESESQRDPRVREAMEVCRPAHDDLADLGLAFLADRMGSDPALERQFRRLKRLDQSLANAFQDVPVPEGLADRILARLSSGTAVADPTTAKSTEGLSAPAAIRGQRFSRRWLLAGAGSIVAAVALLVLVGTQVGRTTPLDGRDVDQAAIDFYSADLADSGQPIEQATPPEDYPFSADVRQPQGVCWRWVGSFLGHAAVAYDITAPTGERGTLYVLLGTATNVLDRPSLQPFVTQGYAASAWQAGECLYVFVVQGGAQSYRRLLVTPREPLA